MCAPFATMISWRCALCDAGAQHNAGLQQTVQRLRAASPHHDVSHCCVQRQSAAANGTIVGDKYQSGYKVSCVSHSHLSSYRA